MSADNPLSMPFPTDTTWPARPLTIFQICRRELQPLENRSHGSYNEVLTYCFIPASFEDFGTPQNLPVPPPLGPAAPSILPYFSLSSTLIDDLYSSRTSRTVAGLSLWD
ncbi:hypothetical protein B0H34DRAFT_547980 [Crassisporium funariophilum]|nr:hypothetical protein B0H34DRAFT_547980 [Crassisporium funariophilum]